MVRTANQSLTERVLERVLKESIHSLDLFLAIQEAGYGATRAKVARKYQELKDDKSRFKDFRRQRRNFYSLLSKLKKEGLIEKRKSGWFVTKAGREKYKVIIQCRPFKRKYKKEFDSTFKLVIFDIPEKERKKRQWLRERLEEVGFKMIQKSVWAGRVKLPEEFVDDLKTLNLLDYIEILAISRTGSLQSLG